MTSARLLGGLTLGLLVVLCAADLSIEVGTVLDYGCTTTKVIVLKELRFRELIRVSPTNLWIQVEDISEGQSSSSLSCPGPCDAKKSTLYKMDLPQEESASDKANVTFQAHEEQGEGLEPKETGEPITCLCHIESLLVFEGASTMITCKEKSEVMNVRNSWKSKLGQKSDNHTLFTAWFAGLAISFTALLLIVLVVYFSKPQDQTEGEQSTSQLPACSFEKGGKIMQSPSLGFGKKKEDRENLIKA